MPIKTLAKVWTRRRLKNNLTLIPKTNINTGSAKRDKGIGLGSNPTQTKITQRLIRRNIPETESVRLRNFWKAHTIKSKYKSGYTTSNTVHAAATIVPVKGVSPGQKSHTRVLKGTAALKLIVLRNVCGSWAAPVKKLACA